MLDVCLDALLDTLKVMPILFFVYILLELLEYKGVMKFENSKLLKGGASPVFGSLFGCVPQCGFSVISTDLYSERKISIGALIAVFVSTSDEAIPIMLANVDAIPQMFLLIAVKIVMGIAIGYLSMWLYSKIFKNASAKDFSLKENVGGEKFKTNEKKHTHKNEKLGNVEHNGETFESSLENGNALQDSEELKTPNKKSGADNKTISESSITKEEVSIKTKLEEEKFNGGAKTSEIADTKHHPTHLHSGCCHHSIEQEKFDILHPILHCLKISAFILIVNLVLGAIIYFVTEERLMAFLEKSSVFQPILAVLIGLIPNCASSLVLTELFLAGGLSFGSIVAGLSVNAGLGLIVLFKQNKNIKENLFILLMLIVPSLIVGYGIHFLF